MVTIFTKYLGATNTRGSRIKATASCGPTVTVPYDHAAKDPHNVAARALAARLGASGTWHRGPSLDGRGYVYVLDGAIDPLFVAAPREVTS
jgi:hypothetical protein